MSYLYAVQMVIPGHFSPIKIGRSGEPLKRACYFPRGPFPTVWLGSWETRECESEFDVHARFTEHRLTGEWFYPHSSLTQFIEERVGASIEAVLERQATETDGYPALFVDEIVTVTDGTPWGRTGYCDGVEGNDAYVYFGTWGDGYDVIKTRHLAKASESATSKYQAEFMSNPERWYAGAGLVNNTD